MATSINVTFKTNEEEIKMYMECISHTSRVGYIKDCIKFFMNYSYLEKQLKEMLKQESTKKV